MVLNVHFGEKKNKVTNQQTVVRMDGERTNGVTTSLLEMLIAAKNVTDFIYYGKHF
jgi:hypothetical protein